MIDWMDVGSVSHAACDAKSISDTLGLHASRFRRKQTPPPMDVAFVNREASRSLYDELADTLDALFAFEDEYGIELYCAKALIVYTLDLVHAAYKAGEYPDYSAAAQAMGEAGLEVKSETRHILLAYAGAERDELNYMQYGVGVYDGP